MPTPISPKTRLRSFPFGIRWEHFAIRKAYDQDDIDHVELWSVFLEVALIYLDILVVGVRLMLSVRSIPQRVDALVHPEERV